MRIEVGNNIVLVSPWLSTLNNALTVKRRTMEAGRFVIHPEELYILAEEKGVPIGYFPAGLLHRVKLLLARQNIAYELVDNRPALPMPDFNLLDIASFRKGQADALLQVASNQCGIICAATGYGKSFVITQVAQMYPDLNIIITTARKQVIMTLYNRLLAIPALAGQVGVICSDKNTGPNFRIVVSTIRSLHKTNIEKCDLLLADECHNFGSQSAAEQVASFTTARRFGLSANPNDRSDNANLLIEAMFGPVVFNYEYQESVEAGAVVPIEVHLYKVDSGAASDYKDPLAVNRHGVWRNIARNRKIAEIAKIHADKQVLILCDKIEHLMYIKRELPEAVVAYANCSKKRYEEDFVAKGFIDEPHVKGKDIVRIREGLEDGSIRLCIATHIFKEGVDFVDLGVLIRVDAGSGEIVSTQVPGRLSRTADGKTKGILIDFIDAPDQRLKARSMKRIQSYKKKGWDILYEDRL